MSFLVKVRGIYRKYKTKQTISNHQLEMSIACFLPVAEVLARRVGGALGGHGSGSLSLSLFSFPMNSSNYRHG